MSFKKLFIAVSTAMTLGYAAPSAAAPILDQSFDAFRPNEFRGGSIISTQEIGQTFTSGITGKLTRVDLQIRQISSDAPVADLLFDIFPSSNGFVPTGPAIAAGSISRDIIPTFIPVNGDFVSVDLSAFNIMVTAGESLAILLRNPNPGGYSWIEAFGDGYAGGTSFIRQPPDPIFGFIPAIDQGFRTFVDPGAVVAQVPEPGTFALLGLGLLGVGIARRRLKN